MSKTLLLLRHAKTEASDAAIQDHERALIERGINDCLKIGRYLKEQHLRPDMILCSDATRTKETCQHILKSTAYSSQVIYEPRLYLATPGEILKIIAKTPPAIQSLLIIAHNPGIHHLTNFLYPSFRSQHDMYPTAALTQFTVNKEDWTQLDASSVQFEKFITPKGL